MADDTPPVDPPTDPNPTDPPTDPDPVDPPAEPDWKREARKHEARAKSERKQREELAAKLKERETADQSEHEKAIEAARAEGETKARTEADKERRSDRLESATIRLASRGFKVKNADGEETTLRFADADDAFTYIERMVRRGDLDPDEIFDETGKIRSDALTTALTDLLADKPHLAAAGNGGGGSRKVAGSADGGKGGGGGTDVEDFTVEQHLARIQKK